MVVAKEELETLLNHEGKIDIYFYITRNFRRLLVQKVSNIADILGLGFTIVKLQMTKNRVKNNTLLDLNLFIDIDHKAFNYK